MIKSTQTYFKQRRKKFFEQMKPDSIGILFAASACTRNGDVHYPYRQNSDFYYLTGLQESDAVAVFLPKARGRGQFILFLRERDPKEEQWHGHMVGIKGACNDYGADQAIPLEALDQELLPLLKQVHSVYYPLGVEQAQDTQVMGWVKAAWGRQSHQPDQLSDIQPLIHDMRLFKDSHECDLMRTAAAMTVQAHTQAMQVCRAGLHEYTLEAALLQTFYAHGSRYPAYPAIVGSGNHACTLHYTANNALLHAGDLVLIDAGAEYQYYAADVTRTFPVNGQFSAPQRVIYELVLAVQQAVIDIIAPGVTWSQLEKMATEHLTDGLIQLGLLKGKRHDLLEQQAYRAFFPHRLGHWLGIDVHDVGRYQIADKWRPFEPGMVMAIEPAIYIPASMRGVPRQFKGIGIRIEDNVLITQNGCEVLTQALAKTVDDIQALMA